MAWLVGGLVLAYLVGAYVLMPVVWKRYEAYAVEDFHKTRTGRNGGGDPWHTDGDLRVGVIADK